jgi:SAM-dependent methyltransferase
MANARAGVALLLNEPAPKWDEAAVRRFLATEQLAYQKIQLPYGLFTPGTDRSEFCESIFGPDLAGKTVLDIGSYLGYFCLQALERGASRAVGIEVDPIKARQARTIAEIKGLEPEYLELDIERDPIPGSFDIVLCLNVLHHLYDPIGVLEKLMRATRERLVLEVATFGKHDRKKLGLNRVTAPLMRRQPVIFVAEGRETAGRQGASQKFFFSEEAVRRLIGSHRMGFSKVRIAPASTKDRFAVVADRLAIEHLVVVAGPTGSGTSALIRQMRSDGLPELNDAANVRTFADWQVHNLRTTDAGDLPRDRCLLEYDLLSPYLRHRHTFERDHLAHVLEGARAVTFVTIQATAGHLEKQLMAAPHGKTRGSGPGAPGRALPGRLAGFARQIRDVSTGGRSPRLSPRRMRLLERYRQPGWVEEWYERWFAFCRTVEARPVTHLLVTCDTDDPTYRVSDLAALQPLGHASESHDQAAVGIDVAVVI